MFTLGPAHEIVDGLEPAHQPSATQPLSNADVLLQSMFINEVSPVCCVELNKKQLLQLH